VNILVTGGGGFIGQSVVAELSRSKHSVFATCMPSEHQAELPGVEWVIWDATQSPVPRVPWDSVDAILHLAKPYDVFNFPSAAAGTFDVCVNSTFHLLEQARLHSISRVLLASSGDSIGRNVAPISEDNSQYRPLSFYGAAKACGEILFHSYREILSTAVLRFFWVYGPRGDSFLVNRLVRKVLSNETITLVGRRGIRVNPVWIDDVVGGIARAVGSSEQGVFHLAGPDEVYLLDLINMIADLSGHSPIIEVVDNEVESCPVGRYERSTSLLAYRPAVGLREGVQRLIDIYQSPAYKGIKTP
jgi:UDP-glucose 4-epimerase